MKFFISLLLVFPAFYLSDFFVAFGILVLAFAFHFVVDEIFFHGTPSVVDIPLVLVCVSSLFVSAFAIHIPVELRTWVLAGHSIGLILIYLSRWGRGDGAPLGAYFKCILVAAVALAVSYHDPIRGSYVLFLVASIHIWDWYVIMYGRSVEKRPFTIQSMLFLTFFAVLVIIYWNSREQLRGTLGYWLEAKWLYAWITVHIIYSAKGQQLQAFISRARPVAER